MKMNRWVLLLAAGLVAWLMIFAVALLFVQVAAFFGPHTRSTQARPTNAVQHAAYRFLKEELQAPGAGVAFCNEIVVEAHEPCPNRIESF